MRRFQVLLRTVVLLPVLVFLLGIDLSPIGAAEWVLSAQDEARYNRFRDLADKVRGGAVTAHWLPLEWTSLDGRSPEAGHGEIPGFWFVEGETSETRIWFVDTRRRPVTLEPFFDVGCLRAVLRRELGYEPAGRGVPFQSFTPSVEQGVRKVDFDVEGKHFQLRMDDYSLTALPAPTDAERRRITPQLARAGRYAGEPAVFELLSPDGRWFASLEGQDLAVRSTLDGRQHRLTNDAGPRVRPGVARWDVATALWAPDSVVLAATRQDLEGVHRVPVVHWLQPQEQLDWVPFPKTGGALPREEIYLVDVLSGDRVRIQDGCKQACFLFPAAWMEDGATLLVLRMSRTFDRLDLLAADRATGETRVVLTDTSPTFVEGLSFLFDWPTFVTPLSDERFLWRSERDGFHHLYLYDLEGRLLRRVTQGAFPVNSVVAVDETANTVYAMAQSDVARPYDLHLARVDLVAEAAGDGWRQLTSGPGRHQVQLSPSMDVFVDTYSSVTEPPRSELRSLDGELLAHLAEADVSALRALDWPTPEPFVVRAADGVSDLHGVLYRPFDFDPARRYPVLDLIYNGPYITWAPKTFLDPVGQSAQRLAQLGFLVLVVDGRGTPGRGKVFQDVVHGQFGQNEIPDHVATLHALAADRPYMDLDRVAVFGGSWGGYMALRALLTRPDVYHVGVAINPVVDLYDHGAVDIEAYMGLPSENPEAYRRASNLELADRLRGKLLLMHSTNDVNATFSASIKMIEALIRADRPFDLLVLPDQDHWPRGGSNQYYQRRLRNFLAQHLLTDKTAEPDPKPEPKFTPDARGASTDASTP